jgi:thymidylate synthase (FAD)
MVLNLILVMTMTKTINLLDHGFVNLVDYMGSDLTVVNAARVSFNKESDWDSDPNWTGYREHKLSEKDQKLISYLAKHKHWTPFAHPQITLRIKAPIFIRTQLFKHKVGFVENEVSRRYVSDTPEIYCPQWRSKPTNGAKQGSEDFVNSELVNSYNTDWERIAKPALEVYHKLIAEGVAPEQARSVLPQGTYTEWWWTGSLSAYARVYAQRIDPHAQWEVRQYAQAIYDIIQPLYPVSWKALTGK